MKGTKLYDLLSELSIYELNRFEKFLHSPYHNEDARLINFYSLIQPYFKKRATENIDKNEVWKKVFGNQAFNNLMYARLLSDLVKKAEGFLVVERVNTNVSMERTLLLETYNERKLDKYFTEPYHYTLQKLEGQPYRDSDYYFHRFRFNALQNIHLENKRQRNSEKNLMQTIESLDAYFLIHKLRYSAAFLHYKKFLTQEGEMMLLREVMEHLKKNDYEHIPAVSIYYQIVLTLIEPEEENHFQILKKQMLKHQKLFPESVNKEYFAFAINYCIRKINNGKIVYQQEIFSLYKEALKADLMLENGSITPWDFKNIVTIALRNKEYKWTETFIEEYNIKIPKIERANAYTFNRARYFFAVRKYDSVLKLLQDVKYDDIFYLLDSKSTLMKTYYELGEYQPLMSLKESFRILLRRKKVISDQNRTNYMNFLRFTMKLYRVDVKDKKKVEVLRKTIESTSNIADKSWIMEKLNEKDG